MTRAVVAHDMKGRTRFRLVERRGDVAFFAAAVKSLGALDGVLSVTARPETASILLHHRLSSAAIAAFAAERDLFHVEQGARRTASSADSAPTFDIGKLEASAALGFLAIAAYQASRGLMFGPAISHLLDAVELARRSRR
jgi:hypothetical protein